MYKSISIHGAFNERTGYGVHTSRFAEALEKLIPVYRNSPEGEVSISLLDTVTASHITTFPKKPSILFNIWEATEQPIDFINKLDNYSQLWVGSEAQRSWSIGQGVPEEFVQTVPEGVDPEVFKPALMPEKDTFDFLVVGQFQRRKSTLEIVKAFLKAFPEDNKVRLYLSVDTLYPSDEYHSTEERLSANGIFDKRIIPVHFETRDEYVRRLQTCDVYVQCSRSEGFGLPGIEAMACGAVSILENWGGSTEYSRGALLVNVPKLEKPEGIYGNWQVPGMWGSPDFDHLVEVMRDARNNYKTHKEKALVTSEMIRTKFSWAAAAQKALTLIKAMPDVGLSVSPEEAIAQYARKLGYEIKGLTKRRAIFSVDCHPTSQEKMECLIETLQQIKGLGYPVLVSSHCALPAPVIEMADYYVYDKRDILSGDDLPVYWRRKPDGTTEQTKASIPCHALAATHNGRNAINLIRDNYDWMYGMSSDTEVDLNEWLKKVHKSDKDFIGSRWENQPETVSGQIYAVKTAVWDRVYPRGLETWDDFVKLFGDDRFCCERGMYKILTREVGLDNIEFIDMDLGNRFNQVDKDAWKDDLFQCHFVEGPFLNISGMSNREYDVVFSTPEDANYYGLKQRVGVWSRPDRKYYQDWSITARLDGEVKFHHKLDLKGQNVIVSMGSKAMGDTLAWMPYVEEFRKKHECNVFCSTWWNKIMDYPELNFIKPGDTVPDVYATYDIGCYDGQLDKNVFDWRLTPLQKVSADILGVDYMPLRAKLKYEKYVPKGNGHPPKPYICFSEFSTMQNKFWNNPGAWQEIIDYLVAQGFDCVSISVEPSKLNNVILHNGQSIEQTLTDISGAKFYLGLNHGPIWLAYSLGIPAIMITGVSESWNDFPNPYRVSIDSGCKPCFNDVSVGIDRSWDWCHNDPKYICTSKITVDMVKEVIGKLIDRPKKLKRMPREARIGAYNETRRISPANP
jgi:autotransporter strand-loop-strand O-heptosyltransferase